MDFRICIQVASIHIKHWKNTGDTGADSEAKRPDLWSKTVAFRF